MKNMFIKMSKLSVVILMMSACSFDKNDPSADRVKEREKDRDKLVQQYQPVEGRYVGKLEFFDRPNQLTVDVELGLILEEENAGVDSDGLPIVRPALRAYFKRADDLNLGLVFKANYNTFIDPNNQNLILTNPAVLGAKPAGGPSAGAADGDQDITSILGKLENEVITAQVLTGAGVLGKLSLKLKDKSTEASSLGLQNDINEKVLRLYKRIEGTYEGSVNVGKVLNPVQVRVTLAAVATANGKPALSAYYERLDLYPLTDANQELVVDYKTESYPQKITLAPATGSGFNFSGIIYSALEVNHINCLNNFKDKECEFYMQGEVVLAKNMNSPIKMVRVKDRYQPKDAQVLGRYKGALQFLDRKTQTTDLEVSLFVQEEMVSADPSKPASRRQSIKAYVQRSDNYTGSTFSVIYNDILNSDNYNLVLFGPVNNDFEFISLRGNMKNGVFAAEVLSGNGVVGRINLKWFDRNTQAPSSGLNNQLNEKLFEVYKKIQGTYSGAVDYKAADTQVHTAKFVITAAMTATGKPVLRAYYTRSDDLYNGLSLDLAVDFKPETSPQRITMSSVATSNMGGGSGQTYLLNVDGFLLPRNPATRVDCAAKENANISDCRPRISGTLLAPKGRTASVVLVKATK
ncbi:MAG: hypothetical protein JNL11_00860 [Bdellovibrionaceae bacterium]|nr:hypothetical protein [Pseudobdellovibrionaceae bacterium]